MNKNDGSSNLAKNSCFWMINFLDSYFLILYIVYIAYVEWTKMFWTRWTQWILYDESWNTLLKVFKQFWPYFSLNTEYNLVNADGHYYQTCVFYNQINQFLH